MNRWCQLHVATTGRYANIRDGLYVDLSTLPDLSALLLKHYRMVTPSPEQARVEACLKCSHCGRESRHLHSIRCHFAKCIGRDLTFPEPRPLPDPCDLCSQSFYRAIGLSQDLRHKDPVQANLLTIEFHRSDLALKRKQHARQAPAIGQHRRADAGLPHQRPVPTPDYVSLLRRKPIWLDSRLGSRQSRFRGQAHHRFGILSFRGSSRNRRHDSLRTAHGAAHCRP